MSGGMRTSILAAAVIGACYGLVLLEQKDDNVSDPEEVPATATSRELSEEGERVAELEKQRSIVKARIDFTRRIARDLIAQRLTLSQGASQLRDLDRSLAPVHQDFYLAAFREFYPGQSQDERYCQRALAVVDSELASKPVQRFEVLRRLEDQFRRERDHGILQLPR